MSFIFCAQKERGKKYVSKWRVVVLAREKNLGAFGAAETKIHQFFFYDFFSKPLIALR